MEFIAVVTFWQGLQFGEPFLREKLRKVSKTNVFTSSWPDLINIGEWHYKSELWERALGEICQIRQDSSNLAFKTVHTASKLRNLEIFWQIRENVYESISQGHTQLNFVLWCLSENKISILMLTFNFTRRIYNKFKRMTQ